VVRVGFHNQLLLNLRKQVIWVIRMVTKLGMGLSRKLVIYHWIVTCQGYRSLGLGFHLHQSLYRFHWVLSLVGFQYLKQIEWLGYILHCSFQVSLNLIRLLLVSRLLIPYLHLEPLYSFHCIRNCLVRTRQSYLIHRLGYTMLNPLIDFLVEWWFHQLRLVWRGLQIYRA